MSKTIIIDGNKYLDLTPVMTSNTEPTPYVALASSVNLQPYNMFDNNIDTCYRSAINFTTGYIQLDFGQPSVCDAYTLTASNYNTTWTMKDWTLMGSNDNTTWTNLHSVSNMTNWISTTTVHKFEFDNNTAYRYYRINCSKKNGTNSIAIGECKFLKLLTGPSITFNKTLEANMPASVEPGKEEIHFTEKGQIFITKQDGSFLACNTGTIIKEVSNPLTTKPLEYGSFEMSQQEISAEGVAVKLISRDSNILLVNDSISLKAGKTYRICANFTSVKSDTLGGWWYGFDDSMGNKIGIDARTLTVTHTVHVGRSGSTDFIYTPKEDISITLKSRSNGKCSIELGSVVIQEIRNNPVNQYGGFESHVLFEGNANAVGEYQLADDINNYDFIVVKTSISYSTNIKVFTDNTFINTADIDLNKINQFVVSKSGNTGEIRFSFSSNNKIRIDYRKPYSDWTYLGIDKVIAYKGQLPSLLSGGEF